MLMMRKSFNVHSCKKYLFFVLLVIVTESLALLFSVFLYHGIFLAIMITSHDFACFNCCVTSEISDYFKSTRVKFLR